MKNNNKEYRWGDHVLSNRELELVTDALKELAETDSTAAMNAFSEYMKHKYGERESLEDEKKPYIVEGKRIIRKKRW